jgi:hypothetical protein
MVNVADDRNEHRAPHGDRNEFRSTLRAATEMNFGLRFAENGAPRVTRRIGTMVNVADDRNEHRAPHGDRNEFRSTLRAATEMNFGLRFAENGAPRVTRRIGTMVNVADDRNEHRAPHGDRNEFRSTLRAATEMNFGLRFAENGAPRVTRRIGTMVNVADDRDEHRAPHGDRNEFRSTLRAATDMNFGLPSAGNGRLIRHVSSQFSVLSSRFLVLGSWFLVPGSWFLVLGSRFSVLSSWFLVLSSQFLVLGS